LDSLRNLRPTPPSSTSPKPIASKLYQGDDVLGNTPPATVVGVGVGATVGVGVGATVGVVTGTRTAPATGQSWLVLVIVTSSPAARVTKPLSIPLGPVKAL
jgi:hypothetical protein